TPEEKAEIHVMAGDACLAEGGYRIYEEPFQNADSEFQAALALQPGNSNFLFVASDGSTISMEALAGKVVLIDFWASWCGPCMNALPHLKQIAKQFEGQPLVVVSISL